MSFRHRPLMTSVYEWHCSHACTVVMGRTCWICLLSLNCKYKRIYFYFGVQKKLRERPFNLKGGYGFFLKKIFWFPMLLKKIFWFWWREKKKSDSEVLSYNLMLNSGKKNCDLRDKKNRYSNSCVVRIKISERNKKP